MKPTLSELEKFEDQPEGIDLEVVTESTGMRVTVGNPAQGEGGPRCAAPRLACVCPAGKEREHNFQPGDNVEVHLLFGSSGVAGSTGHADVVPMDVLEKDLSIPPCQGAGLRETKCEVPVQRCT